MRKRFLGSIAALTAGAGAAWGQAPAPAGAGFPPPPAAIGPATAGDVIPAQAPAPVIMPAMPFGGPGAGFGGGPPDPGAFPGGPGAFPGGPPGAFAGGPGGPQPPSPMWPPPGPYGAPTFQPGPTAPRNGPSRVWLDGSYLFWFQKSQPVPFPLFTSSAPSDVGLIGRQSTAQVITSEDLGLGLQAGFKLSGGFYGDADRRFGVEMNGFLMERKLHEESTASGASGIQTLARPFIDSANLFAPASVVLANPNFANATGSVVARSRTWGAGADAVLNVFRSEPGNARQWTFDVLFGYRFIELEEELRISSRSVLDIPPTVTQLLLPGPFGTQIPNGVVVTNTPFQFAGLTVFTPSAIEVRDSVRVFNRFNGGNLGGRLELRTGAFEFTAVGKFAVGNMNQRIDIQGASGVLDPVRGVLGTAVGGVLANASNVGSYNSDRFACVTEGTFSMGLHVTEGIILTAGYNVLYLTRVARPGDQLSPVVNSASVPLSPNYGSVIVRPTAPPNIFTQDDFWLMGANVGITFRY